ncbi:MAG: menaquinone biosynthesis protein [Deltaproteobacteria bacterium]|jgi:chorismate dehydratase|nr:menaquinone biosynthesis protein [Deltaproteobacteria bacterium]
MDQSAPIVTRLGRTDYINTKPVLYGFDKQIVKEEFVTTRGEPSHLNRLLAEGTLDISLISSAAYAAAWKEYLILPDLSISSFGHVGSVLLLSRVPFEKLDGKSIVLTESSGSSVELVKFLLRDLFGVTPSYETGRISRDTISGNACSAVLSIGDDALRLRQQSIFPHVLDLGEAWRRITGLPFVFALWAVRRRHFAICPDACRKIHNAILFSREHGLAHLDDISVEVHADANLTIAECRKYFNHLHYGLNGAYLKGLGAFFDYLHKMKKAADPVEIRFMT